MQNFYYFCSPIWYACMRRVCVHATEDERTALRARRKQMPEQGENKENIQQEMPMMPPRPMSRRVRWGRQLMSGAAASITSLPDWFATYAFATYLVALVGVNIIFSGRGTEWYFWLFGIAWVAGFFFLSVEFSRDWSVLKVHKPKVFEKKLFWAGFWIRAAYVMFIHFFYIEMTGKPHEFAAADSTGYVEMARDMAIYWDEGILWTFLVDYAKTSFSDMGYPLFMILPFSMFNGDNALLVLRLIHAFFGAYTAVIIYRLVRRSMAETTARLAAIFCMLHPVLICYCGITLKEVFMTWLVVLFIDLADRLLRSWKYTFATIAPMFLVGLVLFMFRTVLGMVAILAVFFALVMMDKRIVSWGKRIVLVGVLVGAILLGASDNIMREVNKIRNTDVMQEQEIAMTQRYGSEKGGKLSGNRFANYASAVVFAPLIFTIPFPTMVNPGFQEDMRLIHGGNWMRNVMSGLVLLAMFMLLLTGDWRNYTLPLAMLLGYLVVLIFSAFAQSLRFHIPGLPFEMMFAAYAITNLRKKHRSWYLIWCILCIVMCFGWNWMKLRGRGL